MVDLTKIQNCWRSSSKMTAAWVAGVDGSGARTRRWFGATAYRGWVRRRQPRFAPFLVTGGVLGFLVGAGFAFWGGDSTKYGIGPQLGYLGVFGAALGVLLAAVVAVLLDRKN